MAAKQDDALIEVPEGGWLPYAILLRLRDAAISANLERQVLLLGIPRPLTAGITVVGNPLGQLLNDLTTLNELPAYRAEDIPLMLWLTTAVANSKFRKENREFLAVQQSLTERIEQAVFAGLLRTKSMSPGERLDLVRNVRASTGEAQIQKALEKVHLEGAPPQAVKAWAGAMNVSLRRVCLLQGKLASGMIQAVGTGWLVGPDLVVTCAHVRRELSAYGEAEALFDLFDHGAPKHEPRESRLKSLNPVAEDTDLDVTVLKLADEPGSDLLDSRGTKRGWFEPLARDPELGEPMFILQHPGGVPLSVGAGAVSQLAAPNVLYSTSTEGGSSGSPCFDMRWSLVAMHTAFDNAPNNRGVLASAFLPFLQEQGIAGKKA
ncbi:MAG: trypsin-like peptidase domain-containing protein [Polyangiaceae bacterium]|nr:trypsin-like peptidase domain-containing protein [Polyangiaceae bacterium]